MKRPSRKIVRQISTVALGLISVAALLLSTGLIMYTDMNPSQPVSSTYDGDEEIIGDEGPPLADVPAAENSTAILVASILIVLAFVLVWFLVFRPEDAARPADQELPAPVADV